MKKSAFTIFALLLIGILGRIIPHPPNFTPIGGILIFCSLKINKEYQRTIIPLFIFWVSDLIINNVILPFNYPHLYNGFQFLGNFYVYFALILMIVSLKFFSKGFTKFTIPGASLLSATLFFLITNIGVWIGSTIYPQNISGLLLCLGAGIPFFGNTILSTLFYSYFLLISYDWAFNKIELKKFYI